MPSERYSGKRLASMRHTTLTGPPSDTTKSNRRRILSSTSSRAAMTRHAKSGAAIKRAI